MSSSHFNNPLRGFITNLTRRFHHQQAYSDSSFSSSSSAQDEPTHYQHDIPGIPTDGKVLLFKNSNNGAQIHLVGTFHVSKESAETVKKVIDFVRPDAVAIKMCKGHAQGLVNWKPKYVTLYKLLRKSTRAPGGLCAKILVFAHYQYRRWLEAESIFPGRRFKWLAFRGWLLLFLLLSTSGISVMGESKTSTAPYPTRRRGPDDVLDRPEGSRDHTPHGLPIGIVVIIVLGSLVSLGFLGFLGWRLWVYFHPRTTQAGSHTQAGSPRPLLTSPVLSSVGSCASPPYQHAPVSSSAGHDDDQGVGPHHVIHYGPGGIGDCSVD